MPSFVSPAASRPAPVERQVAMHNLTVDNEGPTIRTGFNHHALKIVARRRPHHFDVWILGRNQEARSTIANFLRPILRRYGRPATTIRRKLASLCLTPSISTPP